MNETKQLYVPIGSISLDKEEVETQIRLGIQGPPGVGKTFEALTFLNCIVANFDRGLIVHKGRSDVIDVPFWDGKFCDSVWPRDGIEAPPNRRDAFLSWLSHDARNLTASQTLIVDSNRQLEVSYHTQYKLNPTITKKGKEDGYEEWTQKIIYFQKLGELYKELKCNVVYLAHEYDGSDSEGKPNGKIEVALTGKAGKTIGSDFTDWLRQIAIAKPKTRDDRQRLIDSQFNPLGEIDNWIESTSEAHETIYLWQTQSDDLVKCKTSLLNAPKYVVAHYKTFLRYRNK